MKNYVSGLTIRLFWCTKNKANAKLPYIYINKSQ